MGSERGRGRAHRALEVDGRSTTFHLLECGELKWMWASCCLLPPQAGYPAPGCHLAEELQENCECPQVGEVGVQRPGKPLSVSSPDGWAHSPEPLANESLARHFLNNHPVLGIVLADKIPALTKFTI